MFCASSYFPSKSTAAFPAKPFCFFIIVLVGRACWHCFFVQLYLFQLGSPNTIAAIRPLPIGSASSQRSGFIGHHILYLFCLPHSPTEKKKPTYNWILCLSFSYFKVLIVIILLKVHSKTCTHWQPSPDMSFLSQYYKTFLWLFVHCFIVRNHQIKNAYFEASQLNTPFSFQIFRCGNLFHIFLRVPPRPSRTTFSYVYCAASPAERTAWQMPVTGFLFILVGILRFTLV